MPRIRKAKLITLGLLASFITSPLHAVGRTKTPEFFDGRNKLQASNIEPLKIGNQFQLISKKHKLDMSNSGSNFGRSGAS